MTSRSPAVAGQFYPRSKTQLTKDLEAFMAKVPAYKGGGKVLGAIVPHAGYIYSAQTAAYSFNALASATRHEACVRALPETGSSSVASQRPKTVVLLGPDHVGTMNECSIYGEGEWKTPIGNAKVDEDLARKIADDFIVKDEAAHAYEHSIEVQLPFIQYAMPDAKIVPIMISNQTLENARYVGEKLAKLDDDFVVIASSDFTHYKSYDEVTRIDKDVIAAIEKNDVGLFFERASKTSVCGLGPIAALMHYANLRGGKAKLLHYTTSAEASGDHLHVVGYASIVFEK